jgi:calcineurin-like phosphoesterase family protein
MENNWWETVGLEDTILHLGDVAMSKGIMELKEEHFIKNLPGKKYLILGNHDTPKNITDKNKFYKQVGFDVVNEFKISGYVSPTTKKEWKLYFVHRPGGEIKPFDDLRIVESDPKAIVLHGHIHNKSIDHPRLVNLSVEMTDYRPVWLPTVLEERLSKLETGK